MFELCKAYTNIEPVVTSIFSSLPNANDRANTMRLRRSDGESSCETILTSTTGTHFVFCTSDNSRDGNTYSNLGNAIYFNGVGIEPSEMGSCPSVNFHPTSHQYIPFSAHERDRSWPILNTASLHTTDRYSENGRTVHPVNPCLDHTTPIFTISPHPLPNRNSSNFNSMYMARSAVEVGDVSVGTAPLNHPIAQPMFTQRNRSNTSSRYPANIPSRRRTANRSSNGSVATLLGNILTFLGVCNIVGFFFPSTSAGNERASALNRSALEEDTSNELTENCGMPPELLGLLPVEVYKNYTSTGKNSITCLICHLDYAQNDRRKRLPCFHHFHVECIDRWLSTRGSCPICRVSVLETLEHCSRSSHTRLSCPDARTAYHDVQNERALAPNPVGLTFPQRFILGYNTPNRMSVVPSTLVGNEIDERPVDFSQQELKEVNHMSSSSLENPQECSSTSGEQQGSSSRSELLWKQQDEKEEEKKQDKKTSEWSPIGFSESRLQNRLSVQRESWDETLQGSLRGYSKNFFGEEDNINSDLPHPLHSEVYLDLSKKKNQGNILDPKRISVTDSYEAVQKCTTSQSTWMKEGISSNATIDRRNDEVSEGEESEKNWIIL